MDSSAKRLYHYYEGKDDLHPSILIDLFGVMDWTDEMKQNKDMNLMNFIGLYKGLYTMNVSWNEIHTCYLNGILNDLMDFKYANRETQYYKDYKKSEFKLVGIQSVKNTCCSKKGCCNNEN